MEKLSLPSRAKLAALALAALIATASAYTGGESGAYLRAPVGASAFGLGGAWSASAPYLASFWNPAMLAVYRERHGTIGMAVRSLGRMEGLGDFSFRIPTRFGMGVSLLYRGDPFLDELYDENGELLDGSSYTSLTLRAGVGVLLSRKWSLGTAVGIYYQNLPTDYDVNGRVVKSDVSGIGGFTLSLRYQASERWALTAQARNLGLHMDWELTGTYGGQDFGYAQTQDSPLPEFMIASRLETKVAKRPFIWSSDLCGYIWDGGWERLPHAKALWHNGVEWRYWDTFYLRLGLGDFPLSGAIFNNPDDYGDQFSLRVTGGFAWELRRLYSGLWVNYAIGSDKSGMLFDQALDITLAF